MGFFAEKPDWWPWRPWRTPPTQELLDDIVIDTRAWWAEALRREMQPCQCVICARDEPAADTPAVVEGRHG